MSSPERPPAAGPRGRVFGTLATIFAVMVTLALLAVVIYTFIGAVGRCTGTSQLPHSSLLCSYGGLILVGVIFVHIFVALMIAIASANTRFGLGFRIFLLIAWLGYAVALGASSR